MEKNLSQNVMYGLCICVLIGATSDSHSASFDCSLASHKIEKMICSNEKASKLDEKLSAIYKNKLNILSNKGKKQLKQSQRSWIKYTRELVSRKEKSNYPFSANDLIDFYERRINQLEFIGNISNGYKFTRVDKFNLKNSHDVIEEGANYIKTKISYPVIEAPVDDKTIKLNKIFSNLAINESVPYSENPDTDIETSFKPPVIIGNIISVAFGVSKYGHGAAHGGYHTIELKYNTNTAEPITMSDIVNMASEWKEFLYVELKKRICKKLGNMHCGVVENKIDDVTIKFENWRINTEGLGIYFGLYTIGPYAAGTHTFVIPWEKLSPYLTTEFKKALIKEQKLNGVR